MMRRVTMHSMVANPTMEEIVNNSMDQTLIKVPYIQINQQNLRKHTIMNLKTTHGKNLRKLQNNYLIIISS